MNLLLERPLPTGTLENIRQSGLEFRRSQRQDQDDIIDPALIIEPIMGEDDDFEADSGGHSGIRSERSHSDNTGLVLKSQIISLPPNPVADAAKLERQRSEITPDTARLTSVFTVSAHDERDRWYFYLPEWMLILVASVALLYVLGEGPTERKDAPLTPPSVPGPSVRVDLPNSNPPTMPPVVPQGVPNLGPNESPRPTNRIGSKPLPKPPTLTTPRPSPVLEDGEAYLKISGNRICTVKVQGKPWGFLNQRGPVKTSALTGAASVSVEVMCGSTHATTIADVKQDMTTYCGLRSDSNTLECRKPKQNP